MQNSAWLVSRELSEKAGPWDTRLSLDDDGEYFCRVVLRSQGVRFVPEAKVYYRSKPSSLSCLDFSNRKWESQFLSIALQIKHLRSEEDSQRVRAALIKHLQDYTVYFHPERPDLMRQANELAVGLGGTLVCRRLPRKYTWIQALFGLHAAKRVQFEYNSLKLTAMAAMDRAMFMLEGKTAVGSDNPRA